MSVPVLTVDDARDPAYERHGYRVLGTMACKPPGVSRIVMTKPLG